MKYKKKPIIIDAIQYNFNPTEIKEFCGDSCSVIYHDAGWKVGKAHYMNGDVYENIHKYPQFNESIRTWYTGGKIISPYGIYGKMMQPNQ